MLEKNNSFILLNQNLRGFTLLPKHVGNTFSVHNGKSYVKIVALKEMISHKLGEFVKTRCLTKIKVHKKNIRKKKKK